MARLISLADPAAAFQQYRGTKVTLMENPQAQWADMTDPLIVKLLPLAIGPSGKDGQPGPTGPKGDLSNAEDLELLIDPALLFFNALE